MCNFHVGQKVVLVDDEPRQYGVTRERALSLGATYPKKGPVYTIREVYVSNLGTPAVLLEEIENVQTSISLGFKCEIGFDADRFRPVVERKTDISIFTSMLNKPTVKVQA